MYEEEINKLIELIETQNRIEKKIEIIELMMWIITAQHLKIESSPVA